MVDLGAAGVTADPAQWRTGTDYSHSSKAFENVLLDDAPYVDRAALARAKEEVDAYIEHAVAEGYNAVAVPGFLEYVTFDEVGDGHAVYPAGDPHVARAEVMRETFGPVWQHAHDLGMKVYLRTDMLALTTPLERYLSDEFGLDTEDPELWDVYASGLDELYREMPYVDGVVLRIGEAGTVYNLPGWDYYSDLAVTSVKSVRAMLTALTQQAEAADRTVVFRTWSVGVGAVGDMHTNPDSYHAVLDGIDSDHLVVSTKYTLGDFYSHLPLNDDPGDRVAAADRGVPEPPRVRGVRRAAERPRRPVPNRAPTVHRGEPARRGHLDLDPGRWPVARRPDDPRAQARLLAALRAEHRARRPARPGPGRRPRPDHRGLGTAVVLHRPGHRPRHHLGDGPVPGRGDARPVHRPVRGPARSRRSASSRRR